MTRQFKFYTGRIGGKYWSSPLYADGRIYCFDKEGRIAVFAADSEFKLLAENKMDAGIWASPAVVDGAIILRTQTHLYRIQK